jgi:hypothetical protein
MKKSKSKCASISKMHGQVEAENSRKKSSRRGKTPTHRGEKSPRLVVTSVISPSRYSHTTT